MVKSLLFKWTKEKFSKLELEQKGLLLIDYKM